MFSEPGGEIKNKLGPPWYVLSWNARGLGESAKRNILDEYLWRNNVGVAAFQEAKVNCNKVLETVNYLWYFCSGVKSEDLAKLDKLKEANKKIDVGIRLATTETLGVAFAIKKSFSLTGECLGHFQHNFGNPI